MIRQRHAALATALVLGLAVATPVRAAENAAPGKVDREFMNEAASAGLMEVELGRYAAAHATSARVKQFGERMVTDHSKANAELKQVASRKDVELPAKMTDKHRATVDRLTRIKGAEFDRAYMNAMVEDHQEDVGKFREQARSAQDPDVKQFATKTLPTLEEHLQMAKDIAAQTGRTTSGAGAHGK